MFRFVPTSVGKYVQSRFEQGKNTLKFAENIVFLTYFGVFLETPKVFLRILVQFLTYFPTMVPTHQLRYIVN